MSENESNFRRFGAYHTACGRILTNRHMAGLEDDAMDKPPAGIEPVRHVIAGAQSYARAKGLDDPHAGIDYHAVHTNRDLLKDLAHHYDRLPMNDPSAHKHFLAMRDETNQQFHHMTHGMGIKMHVTDDDPYKDVHELRHDVEHNKQIKVLGTHATGGHPFFTNDENDRFRAVHDLFGHLGTGRDFDRHGEEAAFQAHARMFSHHARPALTSETRGQNGSLIVNGSFGPQRIAVLPKHLWHPGLAHTSRLIDDYRWDQDAQNRRAEHATGGYGRETNSYYGRDGEGDAVEKRVNFKDYLKQHRAPEEREESNPEHAAEWFRGADLGERHASDPEHADLSELSIEHEHSRHPDHFFKGYQHGWENAVPKRVAILVSGPDDMSSGMRVVAHVSGNSVNILHCPFCGSGAVIGRSDGTVECGYCTSVFTVQVQPAFNGFPQSVDGQQYPWPGQPAPGDTLDPTTPPGTNLAPGVQPAGGDPMAPGGAPSGPPDSSDPADGGDFGDDEDENGDDEGGNPFAKKDDKKSDSKDDKSKDKKKGDNPFAKKKSYRAIGGAELPVDEFLAHIAIRTAQDPLKAAQKVREARARGEL
jgi:hypothetical protein